MLNCWIQWYLLAILSRFIYISVNVLQKQSFQIFFNCFCLVFDSKLRLDVFLWLLQINQIITVILHFFFLARESLWIPASMNGTFFMVSWRFWSTGTCFFGGVALKLAKRSGDHWVIKCSNGALILSTGSSLRSKFSKGSLSWCDVSV